MNVVPGWLDHEGIEDGAPFLVSPDGRYDADLNSYFLLNPAPENTHAAIAYDLAGVFRPSWCCHRNPVGTRGWRDANADDRVAYHRCAVSTRVGRGCGGRPGRVRLPRSTRFTGGRSSRGLSSRTRSGSGRPARGRHAAMRSRR